MLKTITGGTAPHPRADPFCRGERIDGRPTNEIIRMGIGGVVPRGGEGSSRGG